MIAHNKKYTEVNLSLVKKYSSCLDSVRNFLGMTPIVHYIQGTCSHTTQV